VTFQLSDVADLNGFKDLTLAKKGMAGQRIAAIMVQVDDDVEQEAPPASKQKPGELCIMACTFCADPQFLVWSGTQTEVEAKKFILSACQIQSRKELDTDPAAAELFHKHIRAHFIAWRQSA
jgi:hypothetical protein